MLPQCLRKCFLQAANSRCSNMRKSHFPLLERFLQAPGTSVSAPDGFQQVSWWHFWKGLVASKVVEQQDGGSSRAQGTYMISVRLQLLPTGLISMLSYFLGLMYSEVVLAHLQLRFPFTSRMAEREKVAAYRHRQRCQGCSNPRSQGKFPFPCFH